ncbi:hypothetical protein VPH35_037071 [Triticum aestivum]
MASLADSFLADLDELSDNEAYPEEDNAEAVGVDEDGDDDMPDLESLNRDDLDSVSKLQKTQRYIDIMQKVEGALEKGTDLSNQGFILEEDPEYQLIVDKSKIEKWREPPPAKLPKPLPVPDSEPKKKRGGRRLRKMKERYAVTDMMKLANRMQFGIPEESSLGDGLGEGYGMLGQAGSGKLRVSAAQNKLAAKVAKKFKEKSYGSSGATSGLTSSLTFTPVQGIELSNPQAHGNLLGSGIQSTYFSETGTFSRISRPGD